jgi:hypothetical protein
MFGVADHDVTLLGVSCLRCYINTDIVAVLYVYYLLHAHLLPRQETASTEAKQH